MKTILFILVLFLPVGGICQKDTTIFIGINGRLNDSEHPVVKKEIDFRSDTNVKIETWKMTGDQWEPVYTEKISIDSDRLYEIKIKGEEFSEKLSRVFETQKDGKIKFTDWIDNRIKRTGFTLMRIPLVFDGEVIEFYNNGDKKSVSVYKNNELISNENWLPGGEKYISDVFYSVDREPRYSPGMNVMHHHILEIFSGSNVDISQLDGKMIIGFVVMQNGGIEGIRIEKGMGSRLNDLAMKAFQTLPGTWQPARLNSEEVRYYQVFPINFIHQDYDFDFLDLRGSMLYWEIN